MKVIIRRKDGTGAQWDFIEPRDALQFYRLQQTMDNTHVWYVKGVQIIAVWKARP